MDQLATRLADVEREVVRCRKRARRAEVGLAVVVIGLLLTGMASKGEPKEIVATSFKLVSTDGDVFAVLGPNQYSQPGLYFYTTQDDVNPAMSFNYGGVTLVGGDSATFLTPRGLEVRADHAQVRLEAVSKQYVGRGGYGFGTAMLSLRGDSNNRALLYAHSNGQSNLTLTARDKGTVVIDRSLESTEERVWEAPPVAPENMDK